MFHSFKFCIHPGKDHSEVYQYQVRLTKFVKCKIDQGQEYKKEETQLTFKTSAKSPLIALSFGSSIDHLPKGDLETNYLFPVACIISMTKIKVLHYHLPV